MNKKITLIIVGTLIVGLVAGYGLGGYKGKMNMKGDRYGSRMMSDDRKMMDMNAKLVGKTGDEFDKAFLAEMIVHHEGAVDMAELALTNANHKEIKDLATAIIAAQNKEIADMKAWMKSWYGQTQ